MKNLNLPDKPEAPTGVVSSDLVGRCDESSKRMNNLTREERRQLGDAARKIMYPNGCWTCRNHGDVIEYNVRVGEACPVCNSSNDKAH